MTVQLLKSGGIGVGLLLKRTFLTSSFSGSQTNGVPSKTSTLWVAGDKWLFRIATVNLTPQPSPPAETK